MRNIVLIIIKYDKNANNRRAKVVNKILHKLLENFTNYYIKSLISDKNMLNTEFMLNHYKIAKINAINYRILLKTKIHYLKECLKKTEGTGESYLESIYQAWLGEYSAQINHYEDMILHIEEYKENYRIEHGKIMSLIEAFAPVMIVTRAIRWPISFISRRSQLNKADCMDINLAIKDDNKYKGYMVKYVKQLNNVVRNIAEDDIVKALNCIITNNNHIIDYINTQERALVNARKGLVKYSENLFQAVTRSGGCEHVNWIENIYKKMSNVTEKEIVACKGCTDGVKKCWILNTNRTNIENCTDGSNCWKHDDSISELYKYLESLCKTEHLVTLDHRNLQERNQQLPPSVAELPHQ